MRQTQPNYSAVQVTIRLKPMINRGDKRKERFSFELGK